MSVGFKYKFSAHVVKTFDRTLSEKHVQKVKKTFLVPGPKNWKIQIKDKGGRTRDLPQEDFGTRAREIDENHKKTNTNQEETTVQNLSSSVIFLIFP